MARLLRPCPPAAGPQYVRPLEWKVQALVDKEDRAQRVAAAQERRAEERRQAAAARAEGRRASQVISPLRGPAARQQRRRL